MYCGVSGDGVRTWVTFLIHDMSRYLHTVFATHSKVYTFSLHERIHTFSA